MSEDLRVSKRREYMKEYNKREEVRLAKKVWRQNNKEYGSKWYQNNKEYVNEQMKVRKIVNLQFKLKCSLRTRLSNAVKNNQKSGSAVRDLGCSIEELKQYLEAKFQVRNVLEQLR